MTTAREQSCLALGLAAGAAVMWILRHEHPLELLDGLMHGGKKQPSEFLARRVSELKPIPIKEIAAQVGKEIANGRQIVNMSQGVPCLPIFGEQAVAMAQLLEGQKLPYSPVAGIDSVRQSAAAFVNHAYGLRARFQASNVIVTAGGIQACHCALGLVLEGPLDVLVATIPAYPLYQLEATYFGATFGPIEMSAKGAGPPPHVLTAAFETHRRAGRHVRAVVLCAPNNPTGAVMSRDEAEGLAAVLEAELAREGSRGFIVLLDEVYIGIESDAHVSLLQFASPSLQKRICLVLSASKGLGAMPGARAAWVTCGDGESTPCIPQPAYNTSHPSALPPSHAQRRWCWRWQRSNRAPRATLARLRR